MHPALSVIVFTSVSGLGYGLAAVLGLGFLDPAALSTKLAHLVALAMVAGGLLSSTLHLHNPQRAWRAFSQWRSSWLSREGVLAVASFVPLLSGAALSVLQSRYSPLVGIISAIACACTVYCTAMIYASLKSVQAWDTPLTPAAYLLLSASGGCLLGALFGLLGGGDMRLLLAVGVLLLVAAWAVKILWRQRATNEPPLSNPETATGLGHIGKVRLFEKPHSNDNYLTREMGFRVARKHADKLFTIAILAGGAAPALLALLLILFGGQGTLAVIVAALAVLIHAFGVLVERWLFFAEARHAVMNYYGR
jgi:DMSO reductase anchor subunit